jgi:histidinol-phosphate aminotransferase
MKDIERLIRPELFKLKPYSSARDEFQGDAEVYIDANENPFGDLVNRYPDPLQRQLKSKIAELKGIESEWLFLGNGSDEALDLIFRLFCVPGEDSVIITPPTYGMYKVLAGINDVFVQEAPLNQNFQLDINSILKISDRKTKLLFLCSPNNPAGNSLKRADVLQVVKDFPGIVVIDEAYIDFSPHTSFLDILKSNPNLIITQTLSKAWGMAGIRLGMAFANPFIIGQLNKIKPPYNVNVLSQAKALEGLNNYDYYAKNLETIQREKNLLNDMLASLPMVKTIFPSDANFLLVKFDNADYYYKYLLEHGIVVRNRSKQLHCDNCLRITIGTPVENKKLIEILSK